MTPPPPSSPAAAPATPPTAIVHLAEPSPLATAAPGGAAIAAAFFSRYAGTTLRTYRYGLRAYARWLAVPLEALPGRLLERGPVGAHLEVERYRAHLRDERALSPSTINGQLAAIRALVRFLRRAHLCTWTLDVASERARSYRDTRGPGLPAVRALLDAARAQPDAAHAARNVALVRLLADCGLRRGEVVSLDLAHVEWTAAAAGRQPAAVRIRGKGRADRERITLPRRTREALATWLTARGGEPGPLFVALDPGVGRAGRGGAPRPTLARLGGDGVGRLLGRLARRAGLDAGVRPHGLRHTAITALLDSGAGLREVQRFSRHADPRTLLRYDDNRTDLAGALAERLAEML